VTMGTMTATAPAAGSALSEPVVVRYAAAGVMLFAVVGALASPHGPVVGWAGAVAAIAVAATLLLAGVSGVVLHGGLLLIAAALTVQSAGVSSTLGWMGFCLIAVWAGVSSPPRMVVATTAVLLSVFVVQFAADPSEPGWAAWSTGTLFSAVTCVFARKLVVTLAELRDAQQELAIRSREEERARIAAEIHDVVGHALTVTLLHISSARLALDEGPEVAGAALAEAERLARAGLDEIRAGVGLMRADGHPALAPLPDAAALPALTDSYRKAGVDVSLAVTGDLSGVGGTHGLVLYRIVQEALTNATRHTAGQPVSVRVDAGADNITADVENECAGTPVTDTGPGLPGSGLRGMADRAASVGGTLTAGPTGGRWHVRAVLPR